MTITACVKNKRTNILPQNRCLVALLFKDGGGGGGGGGGGLANHPLSCHPQWVFGSRENERKAKKMRERKSSGKTSAHNFITTKKSPPCTRFVWSLYSAQLQAKI